MKKYWPLKKHINLRGVPSRHGSGMREVTSLKSDPQDISLVPGKCKWRRDQRLWKLGPVGSVEVNEPGRASQAVGWGWEWFYLQCAGRKSDTALLTMLSSLSFSSKLHHAWRCSQASEGNGRRSGHPLCPLSTPHCSGGHLPWADIPPTHQALRVATPGSFMKLSFSPLLLQETLEDSWKEGFPLFNTLYFWSSILREQELVWCVSQLWVPNSLFSSSVVFLKTFFFFTQDFHREGSSV